MKQQFHTLFGVLLLTASVAPVATVPKAAAAQEANRTAFVLIRCKSACKLQLDAEQIVNLPADGTRKFAVVPGEHLISATGPGGVRSSRTISVDAGKQAVAELDFTSSAEGTAAATSTSTGRTSIRTTANVPPNNAGSPLTGRWTYDRSTKSGQVSIGGVSCGGALVEDLIIDIGVGDAGDSGISYSHWAEADPENTNRNCFVPDKDNPKEPELADPKEEEVKWSASPISITSENNQVRFSGRIKDCKGCSYSEAKGIARVSGSSLVVTLQSPDLGDFTLLRQK